MGIIPVEPIEFSQKYQDDKCQNLNAIAFLILPIILDGKVVRLFIKGMSGSKKNLTLVQTDMDTSSVVS